MMIGSLICDEGICHNSFVTGGPRPVQAAILEGKQYPTARTRCKTLTKLEQISVRSPAFNDFQQLYLPQTGSSFYLLRAKRHLCIRGTILGLVFFSYRFVLSQSMYMSSLTVWRAGGLPRERVSSNPSCSLGPGIYITRMFLGPLGNSDRFKFRLRQQQPADVLQHAGERSKCKI